MDEYVTPSNEVVERRVLGAAIDQPDTITNELASLRGRDFHRPDHAQLFAWLRAQRAAGRPIDTGTLPTQLIRAQLSGWTTADDSVRALNYADNASPRGVLPAHVAELRAKSRERALVAMARQVIELASTSRGDEAAVVMAEGLEAARRNTPGDLWVSGQQVMAEALADAQRIESEAEQGTPGMSSGLASFDEQIGFLKRREQTVWAARPGMGKTAAALNMVVQAVTANSKREGAGAVAVFSLEMDHRRLGQRMACNEGSVDLAGLLNGRLVTDDWDRLQDARVALSQGGPWFVNDSTRMTIDDVIGQCHQLAAKHPLDIVVLDYLTLLNVPNERGRRHDQQVGEIARRFRECAKELNFHAVLLAQLNRELERRSDKRPKLSDLKDSGDIEQHADGVVMLYRACAYDENAPEDQAEWIVRKWRNGKPGTVRVRFLGRYQRFEDETVLHGLPR